MGAVILYLDYTAPVGEIRKKAEEIVRASDKWDGGAAGVQITDASDTTITLRVVATASTGPRAWDLRCEVREKLLAWLQAECPHALPRHRLDVEPREGAAVQPQPRLRAEARG